MPEKDILFQQIAESLPQIVWTAAPDGTVTYYNQRWFEFTGFTKYQGLGGGWKVVLHPDDVTRTIETWHRSVETGEPYEIEHRVITSDGTYKWVLSKGLPLRNEKGEIIKWFGSATDINKLKETEEKLKQSTRENVLLMNEIVHRTKNTLQLIDSLVNLQINQYDGEVGEILKNTRSRLRSIALLHQMLNESDNIESVNTKTYFEELLTLIMHIYTGGIKAIDFNTRIDEFTIPVNFAVSLGLIANELITNSIKYAFPGEKSGTVDILITNLKETGSLILEVKDNGVGIKGDTKERLGLQIVNTMVEQNNGTMQLRKENGTHYIISFPGF